MTSNCNHYKKLSCRRQTMSCFVSLNTSLSHSRALKLVPFKCLGTVSYSLSIVIMAVSCIIFEIKRDVGRKHNFFHTLLAFNVSVRGYPSEYCHTIWYGKTRMLWLPNGEEHLRICLAVSMVYRHVTDGWTDEQTSCDSTVRTMHSIMR